MEDKENKLVGNISGNSFIKLSSTISDFNLKITKEALRKDNIFEITKDFTPVINILEQAMSMYDDIMKGE